MKKWMTLIELIAVLVVLATLMGVGSIRIIHSQENKWAKQEIAALYNTFTSHNMNISRWKSWSKAWNMMRNNNSGNVILIENPYNEEEWIIRIITWEKITFSYCSWSTILWKNIEQTWDCLTWSIPHFSTLYICEKWSECWESSTELLAEIKFYEITNNISLIWTWKFKQIN